MTEAEWLASREWRPMLEHLDGRMGERKSILYVCAGLRAVWHLLYSHSSRKAVKVAERHADDNASEDEIGSAVWGAECPTFGYDFEPEFIRKHSFKKSPDVQRLLTMGVYSEADIEGNEPLGDPAVVRPLRAAANLAYYLLPSGPDGLAKHMLDSMARIPEWSGDWLVREVFGNPFQPVTFAAEWRTENVVAIARKAYEDQAFDALPILADAVEEAGCDEGDLLAHLRGDGPHVLGCWALDLVFGEYRRTNTPPG